MQHTTLSPNRPNRGSRIARLAAGLAIVATITGPLLRLSTHAATARSVAGDTTSSATGDCPASSSSAAHWPALNDLSFGLVPGQSGSAAETFVATSSGQLSATVTVGADVFQVTGMEAYQQSRILVLPPIGELPAGYKPPKQRIYQTVCTQVAQSDGTTPLAVSSGDIVTIDMAANPALWYSTQYGTLSLALNGATVAVQLGQTIAQPVTPTPTL